MREMQSSLAKTHFTQLLNEVERGETITITRHGKIVAVLSPPANAEALRRQQAQQAVAEIKAARKSAPPITVDEILAWRHEGHKY